MRKCWNCGQPTNDETSRVCSDEICQRAEKKSSNGEFKHRGVIRLYEKLEAQAKAKARAKAKAANRKTRNVKAPESRERMKKAMQDLGMTKELKLYFGEE